MNFRPTEKVSHSTFGTGRVVKQEGPVALCDFPKLKGSLGGTEAWVKVDQLTRVRT